MNAPLNIQCDTRTALQNGGVGVEAAPETSGFSPIGTRMGSFLSRKQFETRQLESATRCPSY